MDYLLRYGLDLDRRRDAKLGSVIMYKNYE
jgi:hypothetical protein